MTADRDPSATSVDAAWLERATALSVNGPAYGPNPRVGCVLVGADGTMLGEGWHRGAGTPHAEPAAIADAAARGHEVAGATAYVTLEPCSHTGRTGPCTDALTRAGVAAVRYAVADPNPEAQGGGAVLLARGIDARHVPYGPAAQVNRRWLGAVEHGRPWVIAKWAQTLDGRTAAADGTSFWITGEEARAHAHGVRAQVDAILVGTGTVRVDDPELSARPPGDAAAHQPLRAVMGLGATPGAKVWRDSHAVQLATHDPHAALTELASREVRTVVVEGGATVTTAFLRAGLVDELHVYVAPALLGAGTAAVGDLGIGTMAGALRAQDVTATALGVDTLVTAFFQRGQI
ncbi:bifunctional diaminohydroxyphosphoribosylaminopyrimidine deaminase/5-amino-6-(5-phosphoribosylamino)uracil reductase RibD [Demequina lignilytica]|uniref:Riboflavin biosynthesis protein RibD n=1 Tax=Demequina lignilytica TaxID=3051663 RepID=A0AAW7M713_9MICO|nr:MULTISPECIES: bifunctional diaminohydroxyphosphoribosylaminopyrimidine deaminase/5-amino-6-(5-phosphoribosylamino)uracil reductase RibD [unclassified Demequina]MDN4482021.1 bifunctional diaminohydroxyphosphoribosylaminopyrimidine deaminase/5-amino-6-(5-phosphoribosylamino)uracil reductase RibD [Demequina sp. SYSU T0a273]MDN4486680.1 bifunctional diaminohydroxyphosphoribosylaminopyrimidine deaminase/5-amino-6-(5-phosphoribosylamino)uracil reductase RibD [Demequina sp. SYSU T00039]MDN4489366.1 